MKRRLLLRLFNYLNRHHRRLPVRVQRWLWHVENRYVWDHVEIKLNDVPLKQGGDDIYPGAAPGESFEFSHVPNDVITFEVRSRDGSIN